MTAKSQVSLVVVGLSELRLNASLVAYLQRFEGASFPTDTLSTSEIASPYQPWSLDRRLSETDIQKIITDYLSGMPVRVLASQYSVSQSGIKSLLRRRGIRRDGRRNTPH